ncbi:CBS domain-containing protein [Salinicoccus cyprini]|uniref:CBS domain-containing protein n=1 Tax=Salinicoccus cyprini TaxID=2493691 RepID=A0A558AZN0_9STAP|nr:DRTGG domain-containing protein [Salinicoccus cyprini]TVT29694.1 CBS domain-containing protein [Salinicoccus cyprini]
MSKHDEILEYIYSLPEGAKISVRQISAHLEVSDGTSYRAIKDAEKEGLVKTIERVGTIRVAPKEEYIAGNLSFEQVNRVIEGKVLAGTGGLDREISKFIIGAMRTDALESYLEEGALLIVGNREDAQWRALENLSGILITGGFGADAEILKQAEALSLPVISTAADTFSVASLIQRELYSVLMMTNVITASDLVIRQDEYVYDMIEGRDKKYFPADRMTVLTEAGKFRGIIKSSELSKLAEKDWHIFVSDIVASTSSTLQSLRQLMSWHQLNILPVTDEERTLVGIVHRRDVFRQREPRKLGGGLTAENLIDREIRIDDNRIHIKVMPFMTDEYGSIAQSEFMRLIERLAEVVLGNHGIYSYHIDTLNVMNIKLVQLYQELVIEGDILDLGDQFLRLEVEARSDDGIYMKATLLIQYYKEK